MGRARRGSGSITAAAKRGTWRIRLSLGTDPVSGTRRWHTETFTGTKQAAQDRVDRLLVELQGVTPTTSATVAALAAEWQTHLRLAPQTQANYKRAIDRDIVPRLGPIRLDRLTNLDIQRTYTAMTRDGIGSHRIRLTHAVLSKMLNDGRRWGWVNRNAAELATLPALPPRVERAVDAGTVGKLLTAAQKRHPPIALWMRLHVVTGARRSEVLALRWRDVDLVSGVITFAQVLERRDGAIATRPGTKSGKQRKMLIGPATVAALTAELGRRVATGVEQSDESFVISDEPDGHRPWRPDYASHLFRWLCDEAGVSGVRLHDLRHTAISHVIAGTGDMLLGSRVGGHSRSTFTLDAYGDVLPSQLERAVEILDALAGD